MKNVSLSAIEREFIHNLVYQGLSRVEAYLLAVGEDRELSKEEMAKARTRANAMFSREAVYEAYDVLMQEVREHEVKKAVWTKEMAVERLMNLADKVKEEIDSNGGKRITMTQVQGIVQPIKELNLMHGFNETNTNLNGCLVKFEGEDQIPD